MSSVTASTTLDHIDVPRNHLLDQHGLAAASFTDRLCPTAAALDFLGDTSAVLMVRDLLWHGSQTASALAIRSGALDEDAVAERLEHLQAHGLVEPVDRGPEPQVRLTDLGRSAGPVIEALCRFGEPLLRRQTITVGMLSQLVAAAAIDRQRDIVRLDVSGVVGLDVSGRTISIVLAPAILRSEPARGDESSIDATARCTQDVFQEIVLGMVTCDEAAARHELEVGGDVALVRRMFELLRNSPARRNSIAARQS